MCLPLYIIKIRVDLIKCACRMDFPRCALQIICRMPRIVEVCCGQNSGQKKQLGHETDKKYQFLARETDVMA
jgi:hypothetical protein